MCTSEYPTYCLSVWADLANISSAVGVCRLRCLTSYGVSTAYGLWSMVGVVIIAESLVCVVSTATGLGGQSRTKLAPTLVGNPRRGVGTFLQHCIQKGRLGEVQDQSDGKSTQWGEFATRF